MNIDWLIDWIYWQLTELNCSLLCTSYVGVGRLQIAKPALNCKAITLNELVLCCSSIFVIFIIMVGILFWHELWPERKLLKPFVNLGLLALQDCILSTNFTCDNRYRVCRQYIWEAYASMSISPGQLVSSFLFVIQSRLNIYFSSSL